MWSFARAWAGTLLDVLPFLRPHYRHEPTAADAATLGEACHSVVASAHGAYDYYCCLDDDVVINDPLSFRKRRFFDRSFHARAMPLPNRYEIGVAGPIQKLYVDHRAFPGSSQAPGGKTVPRQLSMRFIDETIAFDYADVPTPGCLVLSDPQLEILLEEHSAGAVIGSPSLGSAPAASRLGKIFDVYKPALQHASFFEVLGASPDWMPIVSRHVRLQSGAAAAQRPAAAADEDPASRRSPVPRSNHGSAIGAECAREHLTPLPASEPALFFGMLCAWPGAAEALSSETDACLDGPVCRTAAV
jgi:hypothetical protein